MSELSAVAMAELTDTELDAVSGGFLDFGNPVIQINTGLNLNLGVLSASGPVFQGIGQGNAGLLGSLVSLS
jgi:bacteriocin-like protein